MRPILHPISVVHPDTIPAPAPDDCDDEKTCIYDREAIALLRDELTALRIAAEQCADGEAAQ